MSERNPRNEEGRAENLGADGRAARGGVRLLTQHEIDRAINRVVDLEQSGDIASAQALIARIDDPVFHTQLNELRAGLDAMQGSLLEAGTRGGIPPMRDLTRAIMNEVELETAFAPQPSIPVDSRQDAVEVQTEIESRPWQPPRARNWRGIFTGTRVAFAAGAMATLALVAVVGWTQRSHVGAQASIAGATGDGLMERFEVRDPMVSQSRAVPFALATKQPAETSDAALPGSAVAQGKARPLGLSIGDTSRYDRTVTARQVAAGPSRDLWGAPLDPAASRGLSGELNANNPLLSRGPSLITGIAPSARVSNEPYAMVGLDQPPLDIAPPKALPIRPVREFAGGMDSFEREAAEVGMSQAELMRWYDDPLVGPLLRDPASRRKILEAARQLERQSSHGR